MRITAELLGQVEQRSNPLGERELVLKALAIPAVENMSAASDDYDAWDMSNNRIGVLENIPKVLRLRSLMLAGNNITAIDVRNLQRNAPNLASLVLSYNSVSSLGQVANIGEAFPKLEFLSLVGNPVVGRQHYRLYAINAIPSLKSLDFAKITLEERDRAKRLAGSAAGAALASDVEAENVKTFDPGVSESGAPVVAFTPEQKALIREMLTNASSAKEIEEIEASIRRGILPTRKRSADAAGDGLSEIENGQPETKRVKAS